MNENELDDALWAEVLIRRRARSDILNYALAIDVPGKPISEDDDFFAPIETSITRHHRLILQSIDKISRTRHGRLMLFFPPGSAKSTYASVVFPSYFLGQESNRKLILASYGDDLAVKMGRRTRAIARQPRYENIFNTRLSKDSASATEFILDNGSEYMASGILGGVTGNRANGIIIDDPLKGREAANSKKIRDKIWDAYNDDLKTRLIPGGWIALIQTRWHVDDLAGRILPDGWAGESGDILCKDGNIWTIICVPAICEKPGDILGRKPGDPLWPEWFDDKHWAQFQNDSKAWASLFQQKPTIDGGSIIHSEYFKYYNVAPPFKYRMIYADTAQKTADANDYSVLQCWGLALNGCVYLIDQIRGKWEAPQLEKRTVAFWNKHKALDSQHNSILRKLNIEDKASGTGLIQKIKTEYKLPINAIQRTRDKYERVCDITGYIESGYVFLPESAPWLSDFVTECEQFTSDDSHLHDDQIDPMCDAISEMCTKRVSLWDVA